MGSIVCTPKKAGQPNFDKVDIVGTLTWLSILKDDSGWQDVLRIEIPEPGKSL